MRSDIQAHIDRLNQQIAQLTEQQQYEEAIVLATFLLDFVRQSVGEQSTLFAESLNNLAGLYYYMGEYDKAELLYQEAQVIYRATVGEQHPDMAASLNDLAVLYLNMGEYGKVEPLLEQALAILGAVLGEQLPDVALFLGNLASVRVALGREAEGFSLLQQALAIEDLIISQVLSAGSEHCWMAFLAILQTNSEGFLSLLLELFHAAPQQVQAAIDAVFVCKLVHISLAKNKRSYAARAFWLKRWLLNAMHYSVSGMCRKNSSRPTWRTCCARSTCRSIPAHSPMIRC